MLNLTKEVFSNPCPGRVCNVADYLEMLCDMISFSKCWGENITVKIINSLWFMDAIWRTGPVESLDFVMDCRLFGAKKFPEPAVMYCPLGMKKQTSVKFLSIQKSCLSRNSLGKRRRQNISYFVMEGLSVSSEASHLIANLNNLTKKNTFPLLLTKQYWCNWCESRSLKQSFYRYYGQTSGWNTSTRGSIKIEIIARKSKLYSRKVPLINGFLKYHNLYLSDSRYIRDHHYWTIGY